VVRIPILQPATPLMYDPRKPQQQRPARSKSMTIGIGFRCLDGIVITADTQITYPGSHKKYGTKIFEFQEFSWTAIFTYSGNPDLMTKFSDHFSSWYRIQSNSTFLSSCSGIASLVEAILESMWPLIESDRSGGLSMIGALCIANQEMLMIKTDGKTVCTANSFEMVGAGDSELLRFLENIVCEPTGTEYVAEQAFQVSVYLAYQAKRYVEGCGGHTEAMILWPHGHRDIRNGSTSDMETEIKDMEKRLAVAASMSFDARVPTNMLEQNWQIVIDQLKKGHVI
jgi:hypothetical protein